MKIDSTEEEALKRAVTYLESLASGFDPLSGSRVSPYDIVMNPRISRCLDFCAKQLAGMLESKSRIRRYKPRKPQFSVSDANRSMLEPSEEPLPATNFMKLLNDQTGGEDVPIPYKKFVEWMNSIGMLEPNEAGKFSPTEQGIAIGISVDHRVRASGEEYDILLYSPEAQQFVIDNIDCLIEFRDQH